jgi:hypothetical protein
LRLGSRWATSDYFQVQLVAHHDAPGGCALLWGSPLSIRRGKFWERGVRNPRSFRPVGLHTVEVFQHPISRKPNGCTTPRLDRRNWRRLKPGTSGSLVGMRRIRAIPRGASKGAGPWRGPASGRLKPRSHERRAAKLDFRFALGVSGYTSGNSRTRSWSYRSDQETPKPIRLSQKRTRSMCNYSTG